MAYITPIVNSPGRGRSEDRNIASGIWSRSLLEAPDYAYDAYNNRDQSHQLSTGAVVQFAVHEHKRAEQNRENGNQYLGFIHMKILRHFCHRIDAFYRNLFATFFNSSTSVGHCGQSFSQQIIKSHPLVGCL